jgi:hypothetical protein
VCSLTVKDLGVLVSFEIGGGFPRVRSKLIVSFHFLLKIDLQLVLSSCKPDVIFNYYSVFFIFILVLLGFIRGINLKLR